MVTVRYCCSKFHDTISLPEPDKKNLNYKRTSKQKPVRQKQKVEKCEKKILRSQKNEWLFSDQENYLFSTLQTCFQ